MNEKIDILDIFKMGIDYGQLLSEEERDGEDLFDGFQGMIISDKFSLPSAAAPRRNPHSKQWRNAKKKSLNRFIKLFLEIETKLK